MSTFRRPVPTVTPVEAKHLADAGAMLVDVREENEWAVARIPGARLLPMSRIEDWYVDLPRDTTIVFYCRTGNRSGRVVRALVEQAGFTDVHNMVGGILTWNEDRLPVEMGEA